MINGGASNYHSFAVKVTRRYANGLTILSGYTFSKSIDNGSGVRTLGSDALYPQNSYCLSCERGRSVFDQREHFVTSALYALPFGKGRTHLNQGIASKPIGGWELNSILTLASGFPLNVVPGSDRSQTSTGYDRTNATGASRSSITRVRTYGSTSPPSRFSRSVRTATPGATWLGGQEFSTGISQR